MGPGKVNALLSAVFPDADFCVQPKGKPITRAEKLREFIVIATKPSWD